MLVLNRKAGEALQLGGGIRIVVLSCDRGGVRIGIEAPRTVPVLREELVESVASANRTALASDAEGWASSVAPISCGTTTGKESRPSPRAR